MAPIYAQYLFLLAIQQGSAHDFYNCFENCKGCSAASACSFISDIDSGNDWGTTARDFFADIDTSLTITDIESLPPNFYSRSPHGS